MKLFLRLSTVAVLFMICVSCGDQYRPVIIPNPPIFPNPAAAHTAVTISNNGDFNNGSAMVIDVSGDTIMSIKDVGLVPVHAVQQTASQVLVVNQSNAGIPQDSVSKLSFSGLIIGNVFTLTLPFSYDAGGSGAITTAAPNFVATTESNQAYVLMPRYQPNQQGGPFVPSVAALNTQGNSNLGTVPVSANPAANPVAMAETPNGKKLYVANQGDSTVAAFNTAASAPPSPRAITGSFNAPVWLAARNDNQRLYVLNGNGVLSTVDISTTSGPDNVIDSSITVPGSPAYMWYDVIKNRLYIPGDNQVTILDVSQSVPVVLGGGAIAISPVSTTLRSASDPCATTTVGNTMFAVAATSLPDASRAYIGSYYLDNAGNVCPQVTVINVPTSSIKTTIPVPGFPAYSFCADPAQTRFRLMMAAAGDSTRAYLASCDGGNVNIIYTQTDTYALNDLAPLSARPPIPPSTQNPPQNPIFLFAGP